MPEQEVKAQKIRAVSRTAHIILPNHSAIVYIYSITTIQSNRPPPKRVPVAYHVYRIPLPNRLVNTHEQTFLHQKFYKIEFVL